MVDKIDRPDLRPTYRINESSAAGDEQRRNQQQPDQEGDEESSNAGQAKEWEKFHQRSITIKPSKIKTDRILDCIFKHVVQRQGIATLICTLRWKNGQITDEAHILLSKLEHFVKLQHFQVGQKVPDKYWKTGEEIEIGLPQLSGHSGSFPLSEKKLQKVESQKNEEHESIQHIFYSNGKINWMNIAGVIFLLLFLFFLFLQLT
ncbi:MAG: hypothetical protein COX62_04955 [Deltaproteobacteria bacterium CG_4_10_14_0_2_um_filter_43_8]|nr:MAG: hypothetical protein COV43_05455 [Deltaproteobacteria bacterium CG11_big_fil_rev_8_21_14_0_20_42_23]PJA20257.1 MAG: hypothetical protein COX62_04955 [Deltaproteobacteria bacterium CG_4_10_14_0_2_um_filter_43_8]PJC64039.1 MAG: hypothetical protein CO021_06430 [Deltaproteobacteria bacterium CG_4_9_14_0_2_um_filter_42_21]